jgi:hypothetical protein
VGAIASLVVLVACVKLLTATRSPATATGVFVFCKVAIVLFLGAGLISVLIYAAVAALLAFGYFWTLNRLEGSSLWWVVLVVGVLLLL